MEKITYVSNQDQDYVKAIHGCATLEELLDVLRGYRSIAPDALEAAPKTEEEFQEFRRGQKKEARGQFAGEEFLDRYGAILMPALLLKVGFVAQKFNVPWGCAYLQMQNAAKNNATAQPC